MNSLVVCGGKSSRMGKDKSMIIYHELPQRFHLQKLLKIITKKVYFSINESQIHESRSEDIIDDPEFSEIGPMAALLTYFKRFPDKDVLIVGCDYPLLTLEEIKNFIHITKRNRLASAFYNQNGFYEPLLAWYSSECATPLMAQFMERNFSLQSFLINNDAEKYLPVNIHNMTSADTPFEAQRLSQRIIKL